MNKIDIGYLLLVLPQIVPEGHCPKGTNAYSTIWFDKY